MLKKVYSLSLLAFLFLLPWQTRYIWQPGQLNGGYWEYGTFSIYATEILLWIILVLFFVQHFIKKEFWANLKARPKRISLILLLVSLGLATALSKNFWVSYYFIFHLLEAMAPFVVLATVIPSEAVADEGSIPNYLIGIDSSPRKKGIRNDSRLFALWAGGVVQGVLAISQFLTQHVWANKWLGMASQEAKNLGPSVIEFADQRWLRAYGSFGSPNALGIYLAVLFVLGLILYLKTESSRTKIIISIGQLFILSGLLVSFSRASWLAAVVGTLCLFLILLKNCHSDRSGGIPYTMNSPLNLESAITKDKGSFGFAQDDKHTALKEFGKQIIFAAAIIIFWLIIFFPVFTARFNFSDRLESTSISERQGQYSEALSFIKSNPLFGVGPGAYTYVLAKKYPALQSWQLQPVHNIYLLAAVEIGLLGLVFLFLLFKSLFWQVAKNNTIYLPVLTALLVAGLFDHWLWSMYSGLVFFWMIVGLGFTKTDK